MGFRYAVIGSGRQGTSAAYDLARFGDADYLLLADQSLAQAERAAAGVNQLIGRQVAHPVQVEVQNEDAVVAMLSGAAIQVTFGLKNYLMDYFSVIHVMGAEYVLKFDNDTYFGHVLSLIHI